MIQEEYTLFQDLSLLAFYTKAGRRYSGGWQNNSRGQASVKKGIMWDTNLLQRFMNRGEWHVGFLCRSTEFLGFSLLRRY